jgi:hypothetical protein
MELENWKSVMDAEASREGGWRLQIVQLQSLGRKYRVVWQSILIPRDTQAAMYVVSIRQTPPCSILNIATRVARDSHVEQGS